MEEGSMTDVYGFVDQLDPSPATLVRAAAAIDGVRFAARFVGRYSVFLRAEVSDLTDLQDRIAPALAQAGFRTVTWSVGVAGFAATLPKRRKTSFCALVRAPAVGDLEEVIGSLNEEFAPEADDGETFSFGAAGVSGEGYDLLIDLGGPSMPDVKQLVMRARNVSGVGPTETSFAHLPDNAFTSEG
jgi:hypothetical protein